MHRQRTKLAQSVPRGKRVARQFERIGIATTYELHDRLLSNPRSRRRLATAQPALDDLQRRLVGDLNEQGFAVVTVEELFPDGATWPAISAAGDDFVASTETALADRESGDLKVRAGKEFVVRAYERAGASVQASDPWLRSVVSSRLLDVANSYLGMWAKVSYLDWWYTVPQEAGVERVASQLWHLDFDDKHLLKAFLYLVDVDTDTGPFEYVPGSQPGGRHSMAWPWTPFGTDRVSEDELARRLPDAAVKTFTAPRGTLILCNTSGLHRGGFSTSKPRVLATATFCSPASLNALSLRNFRVVDPQSLPAEAARYAVT
jgi:hypothetical protein